MNGMLPQKESLYQVKLKSAEPQIKNEQDSNVF
jgi:hypothetical protein